MDMDFNTDEIETFAKEQKMSTKEVAIVEKMDAKLLASYGITDSGFSDFKAEDVTMGWLRIAAKNTDAANEDSKDYIQGLKPGLFFNSLTKKVYGKTVKMIVLKYFKTFSEHTPGQSGEFVRAVSQKEVTHLPESARSGGHFSLPNGNIVKEQANYLVLLPDFPDDGIVRLPFGVGSYKHVKNWNGQLMKTPAIWSGIWEVSSALTTSKGGQSYYSIGSENTTNVIRSGFITPDMVESVKEAHSQASGFNPDPVFEERASYDPDSTTVDY